MRKRWKGLLLLLLLLAVAGLGTFGMKEFLLYQLESKGPDQIKIVENERTLLALPHYIALAQGFYQEQDLEITTSKLATSSENSFVEQSNGAVLLSDLCQGVFTRPLGTGADRIAFATVAQREGTYLISRQDATNFSWQNVKRKSILGDAPDSQSNIVLEEALRQNKLTLQHQVIIIQNLPSDLKEGAFAAGVGHFVQMPQPLAQQTLQRQTGNLATFLGDAVAPIPSLVFLASGNYLKNNAQACQKLVNGLCKGMLWLDYHKPEEAAQIVSPYFPELDKEVITIIIQEYKKQGMWAKNPLTLEKDYENLKTYVSHSGEMTNPVEFKDGVNNTLAKHAAKTVEYIPPELKKEKTWWEKVKSLDFK
ncbi:ABC transporter substrate-binding protein [Desulfotomaculum sp. 1211_IL3151]|uniref:ABC transporter substrate-binding protein n=1 Tax=Desulfotomaculum sp. 1211_IL3151 TaxID=3084055 RepID=UPI002FD8CCF7